MLELYITTGLGTKEIMQLVPSVTLSGDYQQCARSMDFSYVSNMLDVNLPKIDVPVGAAVLLMDGATELFEGHVFSRTKATESSEIDIKCFDWGFYLKKNKGSYKFTGQTADQITRRVCADFGISIGQLAPPNVPITRNFFGVTLYDIIITAYSLSGEKTGGKYYTTFDGRKLNVRQKSKDPNALVIEGGVNLMQCSVTESIENMVNSVVIYNKDDKKIKTIGDYEAQKLYGVMQEYIKQSGDESVLEKAQALLDDNGFEQKITVECLGNHKNITGGTVLVREPYTDLYGLFYINSDTHTWKNGQYYNKLSLDFKCMVDEKQAGTEVKK